MAIALIAGCASATGGKRIDASVNEDDASTGSFDARPRPDAFTPPLVDAPTVDAGAKPDAATAIDARVPDAGGSTGGLVWDQGNWDQANWQ